jgi:hypothetical protein
MSLMDKIKSLFGGGSSDAADAHAGHDYSAPEPMAEPPAPAAPPVAQTGSAGIATEPEPAEDENRVE